MSEDTISVILPTYNRFAFVCNAIRSIQAQTYTNIEIIVVNDGSTEPEYYTHDWKGVIILHLDTNTKKLFGHACAGYVRNQGILRAKGTYIAFCDDDDSWLPRKLELQMEAMRTSGCAMSSTEGLIGKGMYNPTKHYAKYNSEKNYGILQYIFQLNQSNLLQKGFPDIWDMKFMKVHNCMITSSVLIKKTILDTIQNMRPLKNGKEDYDCWLRALKHTDSIYIHTPCVYYDEDHAYGQQYDP